MRIQTALFFISHGTLLSLIVIASKTAYKIPTLAITSVEFATSVSIPIAIIIAGELLIASLVATLNVPKITKALKALWGLTLTPAALWSAIDYHLITLTGTHLTWDTFTFGLQRSAVVATQAIDTVGTTRSVLIVVSTFILGIAAALIGVRCKLTHTPIKRVAIAAACGMIAAAGGHASAVFIASANVEHTNDITYTVTSSKPAQPTDQSQQPNIVVFVLESTRADATTPYNPQLDTTPFIAKMAKRGMLVKRANSHSLNTTKSVVAPLCGIPPDIKKEETEHTPGGIPVPCLPELLKPLGYSSAFFQSATKTWKDRSVTVENMGFDSFTSKEDLDETTWEKANYFGLEERALLQPLEQWVDSQQGPFMTSILTLMSHHNYRTPKTFQRTNYNAPQKLWKNADATETWNDYYNTVNYVDGFIRDVVTLFEEKGLAENTLFVLVGDHGEGFGEHDIRGRGRIVYEGAAHVPLILWGKNVPQTTIHEPVQPMDVAPTIANLIGATIPTEHMMGKDITALPENREIVSLCVTPHNCMAHITKSQKVVQESPNKPLKRYQLSPAQTDPTRNKSDEYYRQQMDAYRNKVLSLYEHTRP